MSAPAKAGLESLFSDPSLTARLRDLGGEELLASVRQTAESVMLAEVAERKSALEIDDKTLFAATNLIFEEQTTGVTANTPLLTQCSAITVDGGRRLRMNDAPRGETLRKAAASGLLTSALTDTAVTDAARVAADTPVPGTDLASSWLRSFLRGKTPKVEQLGVTQLRAAAEAARTLEAARFSVPDPATIRSIERLLDLVDLRQPLEILVGRAHDGGADRFVGRNRELTRLRSFVDVLASHSTAETISRVVRRTGRDIARALGGTAALGLTVVARGGLGKSTLIAKFALDHFFDPLSPLPFVYLDFDRASLQPREPAQLAIEAMRQIGLQLPGYTTELNALRQRFRDLQVVRDRPTAQMTEASAAQSPQQISKQAQRSDAVRELLASDLTAEFGALMRRIAKEAGSRAFLIVLDTMEIVQSDPAAVSGIRSFLTTLCAEPFDRLRVVAAGRAVIPELSGIDGLDMSAGEMTLEALSVTDARLMVDKLGRDLLQDDWKPKWASTIAGRASDSPDRREPLTLRVSVEFIRAATNDREALVADIGRLGERAGQDFVGRLYLRRMVDHIRDADVRAIAWPGLVARRLTRTLLADVIAPFCEDKSAPDGKLSPAKAEAAFDRLAREVWVVEREGETLVHRADLRARTLPLMWRYQQSTCSSLAVALRDHFMQSTDKVEAAYYRLLAAEHPAFLLVEYPADVIDRLASAADDFGAGWDAGMQPHAELVNAYLRSRTGPLMRQTGFTRLPAEFAYAHIARAGGALRSLDDVKVQLRLASHRSAPVVLQRMSEPDRVARQTVLIKTGQWAAIDPEELIVPGEHQEAVVLAFYVARAAGTCLDNDRAARMASALLEAVGPEATVQAWRIRAFMAPFLKVSDVGAFQHNDREFASILSIAIDATPSALAVLRSAAVVAEASFTRVVRQWAQLARMPHLLCPSISSGEAVALMELAKVRDFAHFLAGTSDVSSSFEPIREMALAANSGRRHRRLETRVIAPLANWLLEQSRLDWDVEAPLRAFLAARQADWIVPVGYAADAVASASGVTDDIRNFLAGHAGTDSWMSSLNLNNVWAKSKDHGDGIAVATRADEAGDLGGLLELTRTAANRAEAGNVDALARALQRWRELLNSPAVSRASSPSASLPFEA